MGIGMSPYLLANVATETGGVRSHQIAWRTISRMLMIPQLMASPQPLHVIVDQAPIVSGTPEWIKVLVSGGIGTLFGLISGVFMEYLKPKMFSRKVRKEMIEGIQAELVDNLDLVNSLWTYLSSSDEFTAHDDINDIVARTVSILKETNRDRYKFYLDEHKTLLYSVDKQKHLAVFYKNLDTTAEFVGWKKGEGIIASIAAARTQGKAFLTDIGIDYQPQPTLFDTMEEMRRKGILKSSSASPTQEGIADK
jgi:hypothetical protein